ncbi:ParB N-terminal domain-containing protein, partial [Methylomonas koyamae]|uniref:ParB N-terminal domain-containing protein n=1 Tax=Methylomonas koyamae TaxID=702114 RepID=UPI0012F62141
MEGKDMSEPEVVESKVVYVDVEKLQFDLQNPRFAMLSDQRDALHAFCDDSHAKKIVNLAVSISEMGLNPSELLIVIRSERKGRYIALEGNRRLAAMKLLSLPARLSETPLSKPFQTRIRKAAQIADKDTLHRIPCRLLPSREEANQWISLKHTGENEGTGVVQWNGEERARFRGAEAGLQLLDYVREHAKLTSEAQEGLKHFPVTNLDRLLGDPDFRNALGIAIEQGKVLMTHPADEVCKAAKY